MDVAHYTPGRAKGEEFIQRVADYFRRFATPRPMVTLLHTNTQIDIHEILHSIQAPTLIICRTGDQFAKIEGERGKIRQAPDEKSVELTGSDRRREMGNQNSIPKEIHEFLTRESTKPEITRVLKTILFTDIVESTQLAHHIGDREWKALLEKHNNLCDQKVQQFRGRLIKTTGDGVHATFDRPGQGIACAKEIIHGARAIGLRIRAGLHTGECEIRGDEIDGIAVHLAARVVALASPEQVLVTRTVRDLVSGSGIKFQDCGTHELKGFPEAWQIFVAS